MISGLLNKRIAGQWGISEITIKTHRGQVTHTMKAESVVVRVRMTERIAIPGARESHTK